MLKKSEIETAMMNPAQLFNPLRREENFIVVNEFSEEACLDFREDFFRLEASDQSIIPIYVDSFGGDVYSLYCMMAIIETSQKAIATICDGKAFSCGAVLLSCGDKGLRFISPHAYVLVHQVSHETYGKFSDISVSTEHCSKLNADLLSILDKNSGKPHGYFEKLLVKNNNSDLYFNSTEAIKSGLADYEGVPRILPNPKKDGELIFCNVIPKTRSKLKIKKS